MVIENNKLDIHELRKKEEQLNANFNNKCGHIDQINTKIDEINVKFDKLERQVKLNEEHLLFVNKRSLENEQMFTCVKGESFFCVPDLGDADKVVGRKR